MGAEVEPVRILQFLHTHRYREDIVGVVYLDLAILGITILNKILKVVPFSKRGFTRITGVTLFVGEYN